MGDSQDRVTALTLVLISECSVSPQGDTSRSAHALVTDVQGRVRSIFV